MMPEHHYVLVIHGTWNPPVPGFPVWHQLDEADPANFCRQLNDELEKLGLGRPVWRRLDDDEIYFFWTGANKHEDRVAAGESLFKLISEIIDSDPAARIHLIAHSHGANVVLRAIEMHLRRLRDHGSTLFRKVTRALEDLPVDQAIARALLERFGSEAAAVMPGFSPIVGLLADIERAAETIDRELVGAADPRSSADDASDLGSDAEIQWLASKSRALLERVRNATGLRLGVSGQEWRARLIRRSLSERKFVDAWMTASDSNRIGRLVLMGAPFLSKVWINSTWWSISSLIGHVVDLFFASVIALIGAYLVIEFMWVIYVWGGGSLLRLLWEFEGNLTPVLSPWHWPSWVQWVGLFFMLSYTVMYFFMFEGWARRNVNVYFDPENLAYEAPKLPACALPFETLIVHAGLLDEVLLGFSTEPIVFGTLVPQVRSLLYPPVRLSLDRLPIGKKAAPRNIVARIIVGNVRFVVALLTKAAWPVARLWERYLTKQLLQIVSSPAFGLPAREFSGALVMVNRTIGKSEFFRETLWDVGRELISLPPKQNLHTSSSERRYAFLWDDVEREKRKTRSWLWWELQKSIPDIERRYRAFPDIDREVLLRRLLETSLVLEERVREVVGSVELVHSGYYSNAAIIKGVARFIASGKINA